MDRRSWLWRRKKSPDGETESSGSISLRSERLSDDQSLSNHNTQSPEVTSRAVFSDEKIDDNLKTVSENLSEALLDIPSEEDLVAEHARVAEEAVSGWERAENEVLFLKRQVDAFTLKNSALEERIGHLDGALKECLRQLRQEREHKEEKIYEAIAKKTHEWDLKRTELESQISELHSQILNAKTGALSNLDSAEKENLNLRLDLVSKSEELKQRIFERDLGTRAAETASKQHLDNIKKVAKLEAECNRLKMVARKVAMVNDNQSVTAPSVYVKSFTDSQSDNGERISVIENECWGNRGLDMIYYGPCHHDSRASSLVTVDRSITIHSVHEINLMDDFLEMERLAASPEMYSGGTRNTEKQVGENPLRSELEVMINRTAELEGILEKVYDDKVNLELALTKCQNQLRTSENQLKGIEAGLIDHSSQLSSANKAKEALQKEVEVTKLRLKNSMKRFDDAEVKLVHIQNQLAIANEAKNMCGLQLEDANIKKAEAESKLRVMELEQETLRAKISTLQDDVEKERKFSEDTVDKCAILETEISRLKVDSQLQRSTIAEEFRINQDKELVVAATKFSACQKTIASLGLQLKSLATFEDLMLTSTDVISPQETY
ncbi:filament-like plant protein 3 [Primulina eburnea]|uniref:filament-like plant protein 3 n=1 Tax=Primulina eburnea TaxID=1245227 RepID=UPI003C6BE3D3